ncbi:hypothetical protein [Marinobacter sp. ATCH36]|uniref:hypothetical protein n=1 Tax=Marinobacter sp. ATCH36 TaxID=2945106 RepID=UPI00202044F9|nr:hypothetical protein [Marinobacter sp. ATCH36]MCL7944304.1 hypothetical protein [Marinobacter sp. ATCH36]
MAILCALPWLLLTALVTLIASDHGLVLLLLTTLTLVGAIFQYRRNGLLSDANSVTGLRIESQHFYARLGSGEEVAVVPAAESRMSAGFAILKLQPAGSISTTYPVVLVALTPWLCNTPPEAFRQLRVWLRLGKQPLDVQETQ